MHAIATSMPHACGAAVPFGRWRLSRACLTLRAMNEDASDESLMQAYARGDVAAFESLYARHRGGLYRFLLRNVADRAQAEECFQEVWGRVIAARERYRPDARFSTWLYRIAHNLVVDQYRRARPQVGGDEAEAVIDHAHARTDIDGADPFAALSQFEQRRRFQIALESLPEEQRIALQLRLEQELSLEEIGRITGAGRETVKSRLRYALDKVRARLSS